MTIENADQMEEKTLTVFARVERVQHECDGVWAQSGISSYERNFLDSIRERHSLTAAQEETLAVIEQKVFG